MRTRLDITIEDSAWRTIPGLMSITRQAIRQCRKEAGPVPTRDLELSLLLCGDAKIRELNRSWRGIDKPTNVLSFPQSGSAAECLLGDIVIAYQTLDREARIEGKLFLDHYRHLVVHGFLHLLGFDHESDEQAKTMEEAETRILSRVGTPDPYARRFAIADRRG